ncbi:hypothetical protein ENBRE01_1036 [Enteropsectra breve]|nr:hypothetical protein ENBRE01_1036 [Enteropsectra breve]
MPSYYKYKKIGEGTYAVVYLAKEIESAEQKLVKAEPEKYKRLVAIKKIKKNGIW